MKKKSIKKAVYGKSSCASFVPVETLERRVLYSTYTVTNTNDSGTGSLRDAINHANLVKGTEIINFAIGSGVKTITPKSALPIIRTPLTIDATTQPGYAGKPLIELDGASAGAADGLFIVGGYTTIKGLVINRFSKNGIFAEYVGNITIQGNYIGTDVTGEIAEPNGSEGVMLTVNNNLIGGTTPKTRNVISGNKAMGVFINGTGVGHNLIEGNYIGTDAAGTGALGNRTNGIDIQNESYNTIGGTAPGAGNVISRNDADGIILFGYSDYNTIQGNLVGSDYTGANPLGNKTYGMEIQTSYNLIGGNTPAAKNVICANWLVGLSCWGWHSKCVGNTIIGNYIGTDITGTKQRGNWDGIDLSDNGNNNIVGGTDPADRNIISGNGHDGIGFYNTSLHNLVEGNYIGTDVTGTKSIPNGRGIGMYTNSDYNIIGGLAKGAGNIISGNLVDGLDEIGADYNTIEGNIVGLSPGGTTPKNDKKDLFLYETTGNTVLDNL